VSVSTGNNGRPDLRKRVFERLEHSIKMGGYRADEKLPTEHELAAEFEVSRPIIRDVLQVLRSKGLIYSRQGSGSYVKSNGYKSPLSFVPITTRSDIQHFYQFRIAIEPEAAALAATRMGEADIIHLSLCLSDLRAVRASDRSRADALFQFHTSVARGSGNSFFAISIEALDGHMRLFSNRDSGTFRQSHDVSPLVFEEHTYIYDALRDRDATQAYSAMKRHLTNALARFESTISL
jgi:GntR family transcriptional repressor for pyruvate dehydrogenase complex